MPPSVRPSHPLHPQTHLSPCLSRPHPHSPPALSVTSRHVNLMTGSWGDKMKCWTRTPSTTSHVSTQKWLWWKLSVSLLLFFLFFYSPKIPLPTQFLKKYFCQKRKSRCNTYLHKVFQKKREKENKEERETKKRSLPPSQCRNPRSAEWQLWSPATKCGTPSPTGASLLLDTQSPQVPGQHT